MSKSNSDIWVTIHKQDKMEKKKSMINDVNKVCKHNIRAIHDTLDVIGGRWKISIIFCLTFYPMRYSELLREVEGISGKMLSRELKDLEVNKLIIRNVLNTQPLTVEYQLTEYGETLKQLTLTIADWGLNHRKQVVG